jgi:hypothetical protein
MAHATAYDLPQYCPWATPLAAPAARAFAQAPPNSLARFAPQATHAVFDADQAQTLHMVFSPSWYTAAIAPTPALSKTVKRRNRRRIRKMYLKIEEKAGNVGAFSGDNVHNDCCDVVHDDSSDSAADEETRNRMLWNASSASLDLSLSARTSASAQACSTPASALPAKDSRKSSFSSRPIPCTAQLFAVDFAASDQAHELCYAHPDSSQDPLSRLFDTLRLAARMHAQIWPSFQ